jgi:hypothetical protein
MDPKTAYLHSVIANHTPSIGAPLSALNTLGPVIRPWAGQYLLEFRPSGSFAKGTAVRLLTDVDLFISLSPNLNATEWPLSKVYQSLFDELQAKNYSPRKQNVSIGVNLNGLNVDLVPGRKQGHLTTDHSLYSHKQKTWKKTNINTHINTVKLSGRQNEIKLTKIWRTRQGLEFPSFCIELFVIDRLRGHNFYDLANNMVAVLRELSTSIETCRLADPGNISNNVADDLTSSEKRAIAVAATNSLNAARWEDIIW